MPQLDKTPKKGIREKGNKSIMLLNHITSKVWEKGVELL
jgi:hypothetical protein